MTPASDQSRFACYASIMIPVNLGPGSDGPVKVAASLAEEYCSRLIGAAAENMVASIGDDTAILGADDVCQYLVERGVCARADLRLGENGYPVDELKELIVQEAPISSLRARVVTVERANGFLEA